MLSGPWLVAVETDLTRLKRKLAVMQIKIKALKYFMIFELVISLLGIHSKKVQIWKPFCL